MGPLRNPIAGLAFVGAMLVAGAGPAAANGLRYDWGGLYVGTSLGAVWGNIEHDHYAEAVAPGPFILDPDFNSGIWGLHVGLQHQFGAGLFIGVEGGLSRSAFDEWEASEVCPTPPIQANSTCNQQLRWLATIGPRVGWGFDRWMVYATGGVAIGRMQSWYTFTDTGARRFPGFEGNATSTGWFAGLGAEWAITDNLLLGVEYQHYDLDSERATEQLAPTDNDNIALASEGDVVRARLSFKLGRTPQVLREPLK